MKYLENLKCILKIIFSYAVFLCFFLSIVLLLMRKQISLHLWFKKMKKKKLISENCIYHQGYQVAG